MGDHPRREAERGAMGAVPTFEEVFDAEFARVERTVYLICHDREVAKEITQEAFVALLRRWSRISRYDRPGAWVRRVAIRLALRVVHRERARGLLEQRAPVTHEALQPRDLDVWRAVAGLTGQQRAAVVLHYFEDRPMDEVADLMGCAVATARVHLHRARAKLQQDLTWGEVDR